MKPITKTTVTLKHTGITPHDFSVTSDHYVLIENRVVGNTLPYLLGMKSPAQCMEIVSHLPMVLTLIKRPQTLTASTTSITDTTNSSISSLNTINTQNSYTDDHYKSPEQFSVNLSPGFTIHSVCAFERNDTMELFTTAWRSDIVASGTVRGGLLGCWEGTAPVFENIPVTLL